MKQKYGPIPDGAFVALRTDWLSIGLISMLFVVLLRMAVSISQVGL